MFVVVREVFVRNEGCLTGDLTLGEQLPHESLGVELGDLLVQFGQVSLHLTDVVLREVRFHLTHPRISGGHVHVLVEVAHEGGIPELPVEFAHIRVSERQQFRVDVFLEDPVLIELTFVRHVQPSVHGVQLVRLYSELAGAVHDLGYVVQEGHIPVYAVGDMVYVGTLLLSGVLEHAVELFVEQVLVTDIVDKQAVPCQVPEAGVDHIQRGLLLGHHEDRLAFHHGGCYQAGDDL